MEAAPRFIGKKTTKVSTCSFVYGHFPLSPRGLHLKGRLKIGRTQISGKRIQEGREPLTRVMMRRQGAVPPENWYREGEMGNVKETGGLSVPLGGKDKTIECEGAATGSGRERASARVREGFHDEAPSLSIGFLGGEGRWRHVLARQPPKERGQSKEKKNGAQVNKGRRLEAKNGHCTHPRGLIREKKKNDKKRKTHHTRG